jgi:predicted transposase/invertase (TIGR01784 family)
MEASFEDGMDKGRQEGKRVRDIEIAREMHRKGIDVKTIADCTGLREEEVESLKEQ